MLILILLTTAILAVPAFRALEAHYRRCPWTQL